MSTPSDPNMCVVYPSIQFSFNFCLSVCSQGNEKISALISIFGFVS